MGNMNILTNDPSFTAWGWAVLVADTILDCGCIKTEPEANKRRIRVSDDRYRRTVELVQELLRIIKQYEIKLILCEAPHGSQNAQAAVMIGTVIGIITTLSECLSIPIEFYSEQDSKKALLSKKSATKEETVKAINNKYLVKWSHKKYIDEAVADALAVHYVASKQSQLLKMLK